MIEPLNLLKSIVMTFAIVGLGKEGLSLGKEILKQHHQVIGVEIDPKIAERAKQFFPVVTLDSTKKEDLKKLPWQTIDYIIVSIKNEKTNLLSSLLLRELGQKDIWSFYTSPLQKNALKFLNIDIISKEDQENPKEQFYKITGRILHK